MWILFLDFATFSQNSSQWLISFFIKINKHYFEILFLRNVYLYLCLYFFALVEFNMEKIIFCFKNRNKKLQNLHFPFTGVWIYKNDDELINELCKI